MLFEVIVEYPYNAQAPDELTLQPGEIIQVIREVDEGWWEGEFKGKRGVFPNNFVKKKPESTAQKTSNLPKKVRVTFEYQAQAPDEMTLRMGDIVNVLKEADEGWWEGECNGKKGIFPNNFVVEHNADDLGGITTGGGGGGGGGSGGGAEPVEKLRKYGASNMGGLGAIIKSGEMPVLKKRTDSAGSVPTPAVHPAEFLVPSTAMLSKSKSLKVTKEAEPAITPPIMTKEPAQKIRKAKVMYPYNQTAPDELTLKPGDIIVFQEGADEGWWSGTNQNGEHGVFPYNFVEEILEDEPKQRPVPSQKLQRSQSREDMNAKPKPDPPTKEPEANASKPGAALPPKPAGIQKPPKPGESEKEKEKEKETPRSSNSSPPPTTSMPFEKKKFNAPPPSQNPSAKNDSGGASEELMKKLGKRDQINEELAKAESTPPSNPASSSVPSLPNRPTVAKPPKPTVPEVSFTFAEPEDAGPKLQHITKDRPKPNSNPRRPRKSTSASSAPLVDVFGDEVKSKPAETLLPPKPKLPSDPRHPLDPKPVVDSKSRVDTAPPNVSNISNMSNASVPKVKASEPTTINELREWFLGELATLRKDLEEERAERKALQDRVNRLEAQLKK